MFDKREGAEMYKIRLLLAKLGLARLGWVADDRDYAWFSRVYHVTESDLR